MKRSFSIFTPLSVLMVIILFTFLIVKNFDYLNEKVNLNQLQRKYDNSQYAKDPDDRRSWIGDPELYSITCFNYLNGISPSEMNKEHPPTVKYLYGISILIFGNAAVVQSLFAAGLIGLVILTTFKLTNNLILANMTGILLLTDKLFESQITSPLLDLPSSFFVLLSILLFLTALKTPRYFLLFGLAQGAAITAKTGNFVLPLAFLVYFLLFKKDQLRNYLVSLMTSLLFYLGIYFRFFAGGSLVDFVKLHIEIIRLYRSYLPEYPFGEIWRILILGQWRVWFWETPFVNVVEWTILWPVTFGALLAGTYFAIKKRQELPFLLIAWCWIYLFSSSTHVVFPRHLLLFLPFGYILIAYCLNLFVLKIKK